MDERLVDSVQTERCIDIVQGYVGFVSGKWENNKILKQWNKKGISEMRINLAKER